MRRAATTSENIGKALAKAQEVGECLEWQGIFACSGTTPIVKTRFPGRCHSTNVAVCRELWEAAYGPVPAGLIVYRTCCNNCCVLLDHLTIGTRKQWHAHRRKAGVCKHSQATILKMTASARARPTVKHDMETARQVRALKAERVQNKEIARLTGVSEAIVSDICANSIWRETIGNPFAGLMA